LDRNYPKEVRNDIKKLDISNKNLEGELDLSEFVNLEELYCSSNRLTFLDVSKNSKLKKFDFDKKSSKKSDNKDEAESLKEPLENLRTKLEKKSDFKGIDEGGGKGIIRRVN
jgi:hypothetical protein